MRLIFIISLVCASGFAQETTDPVKTTTNKLVKFYADNLPYACITNYPARTENTDIATTPTGWNTNFIGGVGYDEYLESFRPAFTVAKSNAVYLARARNATNIARLLVLHNQIPAGRTITSNDVATLSTIEASLAAGTNTTAQTVIRIRQLNGVVEDLRQIQAGILEYLQRLGPVLKDLYKPDIDTAK